VNVGALVLTARPGACVSCQVVSAFCECGRRQLTVATSLAHAAPLCAPHSVLRVAERLLRLPGLPRLVGRFLQCAHAGLLPARAVLRQSARVWLVRSVAHAVPRMSGLGSTPAVQTEPMHSSSCAGILSTRTHALSASRTSRALAAGTPRTRGTTPSRPNASLRAPPTLTPSKYCMHATVRDRALHQCDHGSARHLLSTLLGPAAADALGVMRAARGAGPVLAPENTRCVGLTACSAAMASGGRARQLRGHTATTRRICDFKAGEHTRLSEGFPTSFPTLFLAQMEGQAVHPAFSHTARLPEHPVVKLRAGVRGC